MCLFYLYACGTLISLLKCIKTIPFIKNLINMAEKLISLVKFINNNNNNNSSNTLYFYQELVIPSGTC